MTETKPTLKVLTERIAALEAENERRLDENRRMVAVMQSQAETLQLILDRIGVPR